MKTIAVIQARMGSTRLPQKIMMRIVNKTILEHVVDRVKKSKEVDEIVIATTTKKEDDIIITEAERVGVKSFRGSEEDVLSRYYYAAKEYNADVVVRITSDCPLLDTAVIDSILKTFKNSNADYLSNTLTRTYPRGLDCEVFHFNVLEKAFREAKDNYQREHVTPYIYENRNLFKIEQYTDGENNSDLRCTLDTQEDYDMIKMVLENIKSDFKYRDLLELLRNNPEIVRINKDIRQKELHY